MFFFFFSSRRRHTRLVSDWSSDVCSSDLSRFDDSYELRGALLDFIADFANWDNSTVPEYLATARTLRSEERRVGKECRSRWWEDNEKKKEKEIGGCNKGIDRTSMWLVTCE